ncbi:DUF58 domain-containing protein [Pedobacter metabolipauper]|uniref:Uncharacterized protein DUF58 n=1 Tax=Pedobacter metabolipauper TaxID=425513 RepID=A0A4R6SUM0_9SPHI|nr:DUF58 domain-containing protein [Pedobacter metabolipauper]TDQ09430.1 uncharacterized protein DUF58 [Pedobacter metabolipauper]
MELRDLIGSIEQLEILCKSKSGQQLSGIFKSSKKGRGIVLDSIRKYEAGDDTRDINWNVTAKFRDTFINTFIEDKERLIWFLIDVSKSGVFGTIQKSKLDLSIEIGAALAYSALESKNSVGVIFFNDEIVKVIPPARGKAQFWHIAREMVRIKPCGKGTDLCRALQYLLKITQKQSSVFIISDFICENYEPVCKILAHKHELTAICVSDERDLNLPKMAWVKFKDAERSGGHWVNTSSARFQNTYSKHHQDFRSGFRSFFDRNNTRSLFINTDDPFMEKLITFMQG